MLLLWTLHSIWSTMSDTQHSNMNVDPGNFVQETPKNARVSENSWFQLLSVLAWILYQGPSNHALLIRKILYLVRRSCILVLAMSLCSCLIWIDYVREWNFSSLVCGDLYCTTIAVVLLPVQVPVPKWSCWDAYNLVIHYLICILPFCLGISLHLLFG